jgi:hypothetical protein
VRQRGELVGSGAAGRGQNGRVRNTRDRTSRGRTTRLGARLGALVLLGLALTACGKEKEVAIQHAKAGDLLVRSQQTRVELVRPFRPGVPNGLYAGAVRVREPDGDPGGSLHEVNVVCSIAGEPGWPSYDNLYGEPIRDAAKAVVSPTPSRWQILYHYDGRIEANGKLAARPWAARLKDNLCRRGDFDDRPAHLRGARDKTS